MCGLNLQYSLGLNPKNIVHFSSSHVLQFAMMPQTYLILQSCCHDQSI